MSDFERIVFPTDFSSCAEHAFSYASYLAKQHDAELYVLHVITPLEGDVYSPLRYTPEADASQADLRTILHDMLNDVAPGLEEEGVAVRRVSVRGGAVAPKIMSFARDVQADLIVLGTHGRRGIRHVMLGSVAEEVVRRSSSSVLTVGERATYDAQQVACILVPIDFSEYARQTLTEARSIAVEYGARLDLLHVIEPLPFPVSVTGAGTINDLVPDIQEKSQGQLRQLADEVVGEAVPVTIHIEHGHAAHTITTFAEQYESDLIVMATHGLTGMEHFLLGSVAEDVVRSAGCPVMIVKKDVETDNK